MPNRIATVQVSDTTDDDSSNAAWSIKKLKLFRINFRQL